MLAIRRYGVLSAVDTAFWVYGRHFAVMAGLGLLLGTVNIAFGLGALYFLPDAEVLESNDVLEILASYAERAGMLLASVALALVVGAFGTAAATRLSVQIALDQTPSLAEALKVASKKFLPVMTGTLISGIAGVLCFVPFILPGVYVALGFAFVAPIIVQEDASAPNAIGRSWRLTRKQRGRLFGAFLLIVLILLAFALGVDVLLRTMFAVEDVFTLQLSQTLVSGVLNAVLAPIYYLVLVLFYFGARVEHEAFDVEMLVR
ncbi:MAG: glycerophosphoryl diester phosphodiesterase membrane domain-containing protein [Myxococcota bacterium]